MAGPNQKPYRPRYSHPINGPSLIPQHILSHQTSSASSSTRPLRDPYQAFTADDFDGFVGSITSKIRAALLGTSDPSKETSIGSGSGSAVREDVFGEVASVRSSRISSHPPVEQDPRQDSPLSKKVSPPVHEQPEFVTRDLSEENDDRLGLVDGIPIDDSSVASDQLHQADHLDQDLERDLVTEDEMESEEDEDKGEDEEEEEDEEDSQAEDESDSNQNSTRLHQSPRPPSCTGQSLNHPSSPAQGSSSDEESVSSLSSEPPTASKPTGPVVISLDDDLEEASNETDSSVIELDGPGPSSDLNHLADEESDSVDDSQDSEDEDSIDSEEDVGSDAEEDLELEEGYQASLVPHSSSSTPAIPQSTDLSEARLEEEPEAISAEALTRNRKVLGSSFSKPSSNGPSLALDNDVSQITTGPTLRRGASNDCFQYISQGIVSKRVNFFEQPRTSVQLNSSEEISVLENEKAKAVAEPSKELESSSEQPSGSMITSRSLKRVGSFSANGTMIFRPASESSEDFLQDEIDIEPKGLFEMEGVELEYQEEKPNHFEPEQRLSSQQLEEASGTNHESPGGHIMSKAAESILVDSSSLAPISQTEVIIQQTTSQTTMMIEDDDGEKLDGEELEQGKLQGEELDGEPIKEVDDDNDLFEGDRDLHLHRLGQETRHDFDVLDAMFEEMENQGKETRSPVLGVDVNEQIDSQPKGSPSNVPTIVTNSQDEVTLESLMARDPKFHILVEQAESHGNELEDHIEGGMNTEAFLEVLQQGGADVQNVLKQILQSTAPTSSTYLTGLAENPAQLTFPSNSESLDGPNDAPQLETSSKDPPSIPQAGPSSNPVSQTWGDFSADPVSGENFMQPVSFQPSKFASQTSDAMWKPSMFQLEDPKVDVELQANIIVPPLDPQVFKDQIAAERLRTDSAQSVADVEMDTNQPKTDLEVFSTPLSSSSNAHEVKPTSGLEIDRQAEDDDVDMLALTPSDVAKEEEDEDEIIYCGEAHPEDILVKADDNHEVITVPLAVVGGQSSIKGVPHGDGMGENAVTERSGKAASSTAPKVVSKIIDQPQPASDAIAHMSLQQPVATNSNATPSHLPTKSGDPLESHCAEASAKARTVLNGGLSIIPAVTFADSPPLEMMPMYHTDYENEEDGALQSTHRSEEPHTPLASTTQGQRTPSELSERFTSRGPASFVTSSAPSSVDLGDAASSPESIAPPPPLNSAAMGAPTAALGLANQISRRPSLDSSTHAEPPSPSTSARQRSAPITKEQVNAPGLPHIQETLESFNAPHLSDGTLPNPLDPPPPMNAFLLPSLPPVTNLHTSEASSISAQPPSPCFSTLAKVDDSLGLPKTRTTPDSSLHPPQPKSPLGLVTSEESHSSLPDPSTTPAPTSDEAIRLDDIPAPCLPSINNQSRESSVAVQVAGSPRPAKSSLMTECEINVAGLPHESSTVSGDIKETDASKDLPDPSIPPPATSIPSIELEDIQFAQAALDPDPVGQPSRDSSVVAQPAVSPRPSTGTKAFFSPSLTSKSGPSDFLNPSNLGVSSASSVDVFSGTVISSHVENLPSRPQPSDPHPSIFQLPGDGVINGQTSGDSKDRESSGVALVEVPFSSTSVPLGRKGSVDSVPIDPHLDDLKSSEVIHDESALPNQSPIEQLSDEQTPLVASADNTPRRGRPRGRKSSSVKDPSFTVSQKDLASEGARELKLEADLKLTLQKRKRARLSSAQAPSPASASPVNLSQVEGPPGSKTNGSSGTQTLRKVYMTRSSLAASVLPSDHDINSSDAANLTEPEETLTESAVPRTRQRRGRLSQLTSDPPKPLSSQSSKVDTRSTSSPAQRSSSGDHHASATSERKTVSSISQVGVGESIEEELPTSPSPIKKARTNKPRRSTRMIDSPADVPKVSLVPGSDISSHRSHSRTPSTYSAEAQPSRKRSATVMLEATNITSQLAADIQLRVPGLERESFSKGDLVPRRKLHQHHSSNSMVFPSPNLREPSPMNPTDSKSGGGVKVSTSKGHRRKESDLEGRQLPASQPPVTRSHCHYVRLKFTRLNEIDQIPKLDTFLVPQCAMGDESVKQAMEEEGVKEVGEGTVEEESQGFKLGLDGRCVIEGGIEKVEVENENEHETRVDEDTMQLLINMIGPQLISDGQVEVLLPAKNKHQIELNLDPDEIERGRRIKRHSNSPATSDTSNGTNNNVNNKGGRKVHERKKYQKRKSSQLGNLSSPPTSGINDSNKRTRI